MQTYFHRLNRSELEFLKDNVNLTADEILLLDMAHKRMSDVQMSFKLNVCTSTITKRKRILSDKINRFVKELENVTVIYINGKPVNRNEIEKYEINIESVKRILAEKLTKQAK